MRSRTSSDRSPPSFPVTANSSWIHFPRKSSTISSTTSNGQPPPLFFSRKAIAQKESTACPLYKNPWRKVVTHTSKRHSRNLILRSINVSAFLRASGPPHTCQSLDNAPWAPSGMHISNVLLRVRTQTRNIVRVWWL